MRGKSTPSTLLQLVLATAALALYILPNASVSAAEISAAERQFFATKIRPALVKHCYECHAADSKKLGGKLRLDHREGLIEGGESGPVLIPGKPDDSLLIQALRYHDDLEMPPEEPLPAAVIQDFVTWIKRGAPDPRNAPVNAVAATDSKPESEASTLWSLAPRTRPPAPAVEDSDWVRDELDAFVRVRLEARAMEPTGDAPPRTLVRRLYMDLIGMPPSMEDVEDFVAAHEASGQLAVARLVDRLLASTHFGERWGRHWLDVARYAESNGDDGLGRNATFPHAWRYRDYVVDAFNQDVPYDRFLTEQIAGDLLVSERLRTKDDSLTADERNRLMIATGFLALGSKPAKAMNTNFDMDIVDDQINTVCTAIMGFSVACARCHDHKHDPVTTKDYYALAGIFSSTRTLYGRGGDEKLTAPPTPLIALLPSLAKPVAAASKTNVPSRKELVLPLDYGAAVTTLKPTIQAAFDKRPETKGIKPLKKLTYSPKQYAAVNDSRIRGTLKAGTDDYSIAFWFKNDIDNLARPITAYLFSRATFGDKNLPGDHLGIGGSHEKERSGKLFVFNGKAAGKVSVAGTTVIPPKTWNHVVMVREGGRLRCWLNGQTRPELDHQVPVTHKGTADFTFAVRSEGFAPLTGNVGEFSLFERALSPTEAHRLYAASGFEPGPEASARVASIGFAMGVQEKDKAADTKVRINGESKKPGPVVPRGFPNVLPQFEVKMPKEGSGRRELATWLTHPEHPLTSRVLVNRIWLHLFGQALVDTPDDFGVYGARPSHPELLDFLATRLIEEDDWSIKDTIRRIVLSRTYQLDSQADYAMVQADPDNRWYGRHLRRRLDAESLRDSLLRTSGQLDPRPGTGSSIEKVVQLINWPPGQATNFHQASRHRSVYLCLLRHDPPDELAAFDFPTAVQPTGRRDQTTLPGHSLFLLNSPFVMEQSTALAARVADAADPVSALYHCALQREPSPAEFERATRFLAANGRLVDLAQALFCSNEFRYTD